MFYIHFPTFQPRPEPSFESRSIHADSVLDQCTESMERSAHHQAMKSVHRVQSTYALQHRNFR
ncbi:hypothetical protein [Egbenema bharatensis]|uniref:hypothetical protein n=1 Tax=Egbenema bharatensis TaxID=3463334 RepID=UPI003A87C183